MLGQLLSIMLDWHTSKQFLKGKGETAMKRSHCTYSSSRGRHAFGKTFDRASELRQFYGVSPVFLTFHVSVSHGSLMAILPVTYSAGFLERHKSLLG